MIHWLDIIGSVFAFIATIFFIKVNPLAWPVSLIAILCDGILYLNTGIYGDAGLNIFYLISTLYGWYYWKQAKNNQERQITRLTFTTSLNIILMSVVGICALTFILKYYTNSQVPYLDAVTTILSIVAQCLICRKIIECWIVWFIVDAIYIALYWSKGIPAHSLLIAIYLCLAIAGYIRWRKLLVGQDYTIPTDQLLLKSPSHETKI